MSGYYLDTSVAARIILGQSQPAIEWFTRVVADGENLLSSRLLRTELTRLLRREALPLALRAEVTDRLGTVSFGPAILTGAEAIVPHVKTLDAIHLASALSSGVDDLVIVSHDANMVRVAAQLGFEVFDPVEP